MSATRSSTSQGAGPDSNLDTDNSWVSVQPPTPNNTPRGSVQESMQPLMPGFLRVSVPPTPPTSNNTPEVSSQEFALTSVPSSPRGSIQVPPAPNNTPQVSLQGSIQLSLAGFPRISIQRSVPISDSSFASSVLNSSRSSVQETVPLSSFSGAPVQEQPPPLVLGYLRSSVPGSVTLSDSSRASIRGSHHHAQLPGVPKIPGSVTFL
ncbi:WAS/WASL-interacting protein family member 1-like [Pteropus medius]|uniref:WAS/WASL-interacting protein family member 1-like n=1 Tax=Pteropus vampyrus TaxID=132908 RepID=UPI00196B66B2|nr:WAS/WASL-interacting protein family member 1-like [Pteropus giganteus]